MCCGVRGVAVAGRTHPRALALLQARGVNLLVLDEPTNHLDLPAIEQLEQAMESFTGTLLLVTTTVGCWAPCGTPGAGTWTVAG
ncbi:hypothetical protein GS426_06795 [Rhodococcus hoagii]|nr:hypothetical protein [Prescottella equi]